MSADFINVTVKKLKNKNKMIGNKSIRLPISYSQPNTLNTDFPNPLTFQKNSTQNSQRLISSIDRASQNGYQSPNVHVSKEVKKREQGGKEEVISVKPPFYKQGRRNNSAEGNGNQIQNKKLISYPLQSHQNKSKDIQMTKNSQCNESFGVNLFSTKELLQKIDNLTYSVRKVEKRLTKVQKFNINQSMDNIENQHNLSNSYRFGIDSSEKQFLEKIHKLKEDVGCLRQQLKTHIKWENIDKIVQKIKEQLESSKTSSCLSSSILNEDVLSGMKRQIEGVSTEIQEKIKKNNEFLLSVTHKLEQEMKSNLMFQSPCFKSSGIKCSGSAILLRFVESFRVRKNAGKKCETKIVLTDNTYYIDNEGFLLDKDQQYLVDGSGNQIKLQEKHLRMLKEEQILQ